MKEIPEELTKEDLTELSCYRRNQAKYDPLTETFSDFPKCPKLIVTQAFQGNATMQTILFGKFLILAEHKLFTNTNTESSATRERPHKKNRTFSRLQTAVKQVYGSEKVSAL